MALPQDQQWREVRVKLFCTLRDQEVSEFKTLSSNQNATCLFTLEKNSKEIAWCWQGLIFISTKAAVENFYFQ